MTDVLDRPAPTAATAPGRGTLVASAAVAALGAAAVSLVAVSVVVLLVWFSDGRSGSTAGEAVATSVQGWLLLHGATLDVPGGRLGLTPWGATLLPALLLLRVGRHLAEDLVLVSVAEVARAVAAVAVVYGLVGLAAAGFAGTASVQPGLLSAALATGGLAAVCVGGGALTRAGLVGTALRRVPASARPVLAAGGRAAATLLGGAGVVVGVTLVLHLGPALTVGSLLAPGLVGGLALALLCLALVPTAVVFGLAYLAGAGFALGSATGVGPFGVETVPLPPLPLLAAVPTGGAPLLLLPVLALPLLAAGVVAGVVLHRRVGPVGLRAQARASAGAGAVAGVAVAVLCGLAAGPVGGGRLSEVGPSAWRVGLLVALEVSALAWLTTVLAARPRVAGPARTAVGAVTATLGTARRRGASAAGAVRARVPLARPRRG